MAAGALTAGFANHAAAAEAYFYFKDHDSDDGFKSLIEASGSVDLGRIELSDGGTSINPTGYYIREGRIISNREIVVRATLNIHILDGHLLFLEVHCFH